MSERLVLKDAKLVHLLKCPGSDGTTQTLKLRALLTRTLAEQLGCKDLCFAENGVPRRFDKVKLKQNIDNVEVMIDKGGSLIANSVSPLTVGVPKGASETDNSLEIYISLHFDGKVPLSEWFDQRNKSEFEVTIKPPADWNAQQNLFDKADPDTWVGDDDEGAKEDDSQEPITANLKGEALKNDQALENASTATALKPGPVLASAREAAGGTHQRRKRSGVVTITIPPEEVTTVQ